MLTEWGGRGGDGEGGGKEDSEDVRRYMTSVSC